MAIECRQVTPDHCITLRAILNPQAGLTTHSYPAIACTAMSDLLPNKNLIPFQDAIKLLDKAASQLQSFSQHSADSSFVGIEHHQLQQLEVVLAHLPSSQMHIDSTDKHQTGKLEAKEAERVMKKMDLVAQKISRKKISAEEVMKEIHDDAQPTYAKKALKTLLASENTFVSSTQSINKHETLKEEKSCTVIGQSIHELIIDITQFNLADGKVDAILARTVSANSYFEHDQMSRQLIHLKILDSANMFCLLQAASLNWPIQARIKMDIQFKQQKLIFNGVLIEIPDQEKLIQTLQQATTKKQKELFETQ